MTAARLSYLLTATDVIIQYTAVLIPVNYLQYLSAFMN